MTPMGVPFWPIVPYRSKRCQWGQPITDGCATAATTRRHNPVDGATRDLCDHHAATYDRIVGTVERLRPILDRLRDHDLD